MHIYQSKIDFFMWVCDDEDGLFREIEHTEHTINMKMITQFPQSPISPWIFYMILPYDVVLSMLKSHSLWYFILLIFISFFSSTLHLILFHMQSIAPHYFLYSHMITHLICSWESHHRTFFLSSYLTKKNAIQNKRMSLSFTRNKVQSAYELTCKRRSFTFNK